jgi:hypothetical protein
VHSGGGMSLERRICLRSVCFELEQRCVAQDRKRSDEGTLDRPDEPLEAVVEECGQMILHLGAPNTLVRFEMSRRSAKSSFEGVLGGGISFSTQHRRKNAKNEMGAQLS